MFEVGDYCICPSVPVFDEFWSKEDHGPYVGFVGKVTNYMNGYGVDANYVLLDFSENTKLDPDDRKSIWFKEEWMEHHIEDQIVSYQCVCPSVWQPCSCGAFQQEMEAKGLIRNSVTGFWEPRI